MKRWIDFQDLCTHVDPSAVNLLLDRHLWLIPTQSCRRVRGALAECEGFAANAATGL